ncbi:alpha/beta hydrolase [Corynebacterium bovis]|uniref:alpha/beta hydrolase n=1 Tax=Corynebacterium bovis TaxID=36808 RepID=UPI00264CFC17|nr:alpha/beta hydrolase [Corynebacterium bovis]MDN8579721.1 alpha/beta hydrolase [Corynebacterium bovis]
MDDRTPVGAGRGAGADGTAGAAAPAAGRGSARGTTRGSARGTARPVRGRRGVVDRLESTWERFRLDPWGLILGGLGFALALTPSLLPRDWLFQGVACGLTAATWYGVGVLLHVQWDLWLGRIVLGAVSPWLADTRGAADRWIGSFLTTPVSGSGRVGAAAATGGSGGSAGERAGGSPGDAAGGPSGRRRPGLPRRPHLSRRWRMWAEGALGGVIVVALLVWVLYAVRWQRELAGIMGARAYTPAQFLLVLPVGLVIWAVLVVVGRLFIWLGSKAADAVPGTAKHTSTRLLVSWGTAAVLAVLVVDQVIPGTVVQVSERVFSVRNDEVRPDLVRPHVTERSGGPGSPNEWTGLGAYGTRFTALGLYRDELEELTGRPAKEPIRVYAGLDDGDDDTERADSVVRELLRTHAADRKALMVVPTTGTGWVNPTAAQAFELMHDGDTAIAAAQYSYLPSAVQFLSDKEEIREAGRALVTAVVDWWHTLPADHRPRIYVYGESLGTTAGEGAFSGLRDIASSVDGVLWMGPPNFNQLHSELVERRDPGSPEVQPEYSGGLTVRFAQNRDVIDRWLRRRSDPSILPWSGARVLYVQHPSDPVVWWSPSLLVERPDWLREPAGFDRSPSMRWMPFVTFWQVSLDLPMAANVPNGHGHNYGSTVIDGLAAIDRDDAVSVDDLDRLRDELDRAIATQGPEKELGVDNG